MMKKKAYEPLVALGIEESLVEKAFKGSNISSEDIEHLVMLTAAQNRRYMAQVICRFTFRQIQQNVKGQYND